MNTKEMIKCDIDPKSGKEFIEQLTEYCVKKTGTVASIIRRY